MLYNRDTRPNSEYRGTRLATKLLLAFLLASVVVALLGAGGWMLLRDTHGEIETLRSVAGGGEAAAIAARLLTRTDEVGMLVAGGVFFSLILFVVLYLYLTRAAIRPLQTNERLVSRLAVGDCGEDAPAEQLARGDEAGDLARAVQALTTYQRKEADIANDMSAGDFSGAATVHGPSDQLGLAIRRMAGVTINMLKHVNTHVAQVMTGCEAIASTNGELSANSAGISAAATEVSDGIGQLKTHASGNADMAKQAGKLAGNGSQSIERGYEDIGEMGVVMLNMQVCGDKIVQIAKSIGDIAFQTNLLALNASVEAARAGRHGKGFTIVAEEVRSLAVRSRKAAEETSSLMKETVEQVELAAAIAGRINAIFVDMQTNIQEAEALLTKIATVSGEQADNIEQISAVLRRMDRSARENMEYVDTVLKKVDGLARHTGRLGQALGRFRLDYAHTPDSGPEDVDDAPLPQREVAARRLGMES